MIRQFRFAIIPADLLPRSIVCANIPIRKALGETLEIVFVHFGPRIPEYLQLNLQRTCDLLPDQSIALLTDRTQNISVKNGNFRIQVISFDDEYALVNKSLNHPADFRDNFWFSSLARLIAIADYVIRTEQSVLHIESDVLISPDFPVAKFRAVDRPLAYTMVGKHSGVASVLFLGSADSANFFKEYIISKVLDNPGTTDMKILGLLKSQHPDLVRILASFPVKETTAYSPIDPSIRDDFEYSEYLFSGFFDSADIGQYLLGDDPRNHRGVKYLRRELSTSYLKAGLLDYTFSSERQFISLASGSTRKIYSLHVHSKNPKVFSERFSNRVMMKSLLEQNLPEKHILILSIFLKAIKISIWRRLKKILRT